MSNTLPVTFAFTLAVAFGLVVKIVLQQIEISHFRSDIKCLKKPHGESSVTGVMKTVNGKRTFIVTQPTRTGC
jgi:hypothetical protein